MRLWFFRHSWSLIAQVTAMATPHAVFVVKPATVSYGEAMNQLHNWLDSRKIQISGFRLTALDGQRAGFELTFRIEQDAAGFRQGFTWVQPFKHDPFPPERPRRSVRVQRRGSMHDQEGTAGSRSGSPLDDRSVAEDGEIRGG